MNSHDDNRIKKSKKSSDILCLSVCGQLTLKCLFKLFLLKSSKLKVNHTTSDETMNVGVSKKGKLRPGSLNLVRILKLT